MANQDNIITPEMQAEMKRLGREWMFADQKRKIQKFDVLNRKAIKGGIVFLGDSITESYPINELIQTSFPLYNRGISGYTSKQMRENLKEMVLDLKPSIVFLLIGTNDSEFEISPQQSAKNIQYICQTISDEVVGATVYVQQVYPVNMSFTGSIGNRTNQDINTINSLAKEYTLDINRVECLDLSNVLSINGDLNSEFTHDGLHLNMYGYKAVTERLRTYIK